MKELLEFILENITGKKDFSVEEETVNDRINLIIKTKPENIGLIIGKGGNTIKAIQDVLRVRARLEKVMVNVSVLESE